MLPSSESMASGNPSLGGYRHLAFSLCLGVGLLGHSISNSQASTDERGIYQAVLASLFDGRVPSALVVTTPVLAMRVPAAWQWQQLGVAAEALRSKVDARIQAQAVQSSSATFPVEWFPAGTTLVPYGEIEELLRSAPRGGTPENVWIPFRTRFGVPTYQGFSLPVLSDDQLNALVWYRHSCGSLCGEAGFAWLQRRSPAAEWVVVKRVPTAIA
jgi:hypothetical protein